MTIFEPIAVPAELRNATSARAWLDAMLEAERALALAEADAGVVPREAAAAIAAACRGGAFEYEQLVERGHEVGNPVEPLVRALRETIGGDAAPWVHWGATSQDVLDTASMLVARGALALVLAELDRVAAACARHAREHRGTVLAARTLLQQAVPTTFGLKTAGWLVGVLDARRALRRWQPAAQLGGAAGTLASLGDDGSRVARLFAAQLDLAEAPLPWHANRVRVAELGAALAIAAGAVAKIGLDVALLAQTEVAEVAPPSGGGSSTMPQKRNPVGSALAFACARQVAADASVLTASLVQAHERGAWHAEWDALSRALALSGGAARAVAELLEGLEVDAERMRANVGDSTLAEAERFAPQTSRPEDYLGSAALFVERALALYEEEA